VSIKTQQHLHMKLLYLFFGDDFSKTDGVTNKLFSKIEALNQYTEHTHLVSFSDKVKELTQMNETTFIYPIQKIHKGKYFHTYNGRKELFDNVIDFLDKNAAKYDKIIMRYPLADAHSNRLFKKYKITVEHNTIEESEMKADVGIIHKGIPFSFKPGYFLYVLDRVKLPLLFEKYYAKKILKNIPLGICVTKEIAAYEKSRYSKYKTEVITNGIDTSKIKLRNKQKDSTIIKGFLLAGQNTPWHGIDRIIEGILLYNNSEDFEIHLIGAIDQSHSELIKKKNIKNIYIHSKKSTNEIELFTENFDFSFGSLALYRAGLKEATPLKVREGLARGFPIVNAYYDTDIESSTELKKYCTTFSNDGSPIDFNLIKQFIDNINLDIEHPRKIRQLAEPLIDVNQKMKTLVSKLAQYN
jgi:glycosyltransferase involved in cell wall biosynthesis